MSTTLSTACTAASNYACSTPFMTITASSRSPGQARGPCLMARGVSSPRCCARASGQAATRSAPSCAASSAPSAPSGRGSRSCCAPILTTPARRSSTGAERTGSIGCWGWLPIRPLPPRRCLLAPLVDAPADAQRLGLARHAVRHSAAAPHQNRRPRRRTAKADQDPPAVEHPRSGGLRHGSQPPAAPSHLKTGAWCPAAPLLPSTPSAYPIQTKQTRRGGKDTPSRPPSAQTKNPPPCFTLVHCTFVRHRSSYELLRVSIVHSDRSTAPLNY